MRNAMWVGGGITGMGEIPMLGVKEKGFAKIMRDLFKNNEQGFWYDPDDLTEDKIKWRRNLLTETEFRNGVSDAPSRGNVSAASFVGVGSKQTGLLIDNISKTVDTYAYKSFSEWKDNVSYTLSVFLRMQDGSAPVIGASGLDSRGDIGLVIRGVYVRDFELHDLGEGLYRATATVTNSTGLGGVGVVKYKAFTARPVLVTGYQLEEGTKATTYQPFTDFNSEFVTRFPYHTLFQDAAGIVPVTGVGQPIGLMLDKSKGLSLVPRNLQPVLSLSGTGAAEIRPDNTFYVMRGSEGNAGAINIATNPNEWYKLVIEILSGNPVSIRTGAGIQVLALKPSHGKFTLYVNMASFPYLRFVNIMDNQETVFKIHSLDAIKGNHAYQETSAARPLLKNTPRLIDFDEVDDKLITNLPAQLRDCTVLRAVPNLGTQVKYNQTLPLLYEDSADHAGLVAINRALTRNEQLRLMEELDKRAGATSLDTLTLKTFNNNQEGFVYDPNDLSTMYQDAAGTTPVTAVGEPVGLILDKRKGSTTGANLHTAATPLNQTTYPSVSTRSGLDITVTKEASGYASTSLSIPTVIGKTYLLELIAPDTTGFWVLVSDSAAGDSINRKTAIQNAPESRSNTKITFVFTATAAMSYVHLNRGSTTVGSYTFKEVSVREVLGNHAYQTNSASRPILRQNATTGAYYLEFDGADDYLQTSVSLPFPVTAVVPFDFKSNENNKCILSAGGPGYLRSTTHSASVHTLSGNSGLVAKKKVDVLLHELTGGSVNIRSNTDAATLSDVDANVKNTYLGSNKFIGTFTDTHTFLRAAMDLYGMVVVKKVLSTSEETELRTHFNKRMGI